MSGVRLHQKLENNIGLLIFGILFVASIGGAAQVVPALFQDSLQQPGVNTVPYTAAELDGRDIYMRESCGVCHTQHIRPLLAEVERYGPYSRAGEFVYDRPFLWGSKRTGPDLHRIGGKYSDEWHWIHMMDPRAVVPDSIMPAYPWLADAPANRGNDIDKRMRALQKLGHPYNDEEIADAAASLEGLTEMDVLIIYLQGMGDTVDPDAADDHGGHGG
ncbi:MAG: cytochrome-c oxidase, cbb3-type subunit II [Xanthomonadales bacterium]|nr:cytochrome-c oxidase, cbb3-type subunit II [Xanthomonadales bacterium]NIN60283.1 cytochrome-c oxidase, cbb3-type subunit II [Xanthomonadales bacterium]NIN75635.1 cytochrome-c oxidase, cbb3-type subunit II [Xanthomonadales bacterium]NIO14708.1 cytochrome-c oxidase, cbb3-type subunit II [Xanthomonadales bacterium]NIP12676.1 cytochrome-c oxidase, cbb3-type subunit II [Xanthomonadales bacterium]